jgi:hypothetical protein
MNLMVDIITIKGYIWETIIEARRTRIRTNEQDSMHIDNSNVPQPQKLTQHPETNTRNNSHKLKDNL